MKASACFPALAILAACLATGCASAQPSQTAQAGSSAVKPARHADQCFLNSDYRGFRPAGDTGMIILVGASDYYKVDFQGTCPEIKYPDARLITVVRGSDFICNGLDWDLRIGQSAPGFEVPCIVKSQRKLTKDEVAALPPKERP